jgi:hypothetical protein
MYADVYLRKKGWMFAQDFAGWQILFLDEHKRLCGQATGKTAQLSGANEQIEKLAQRSGRHIRATYTK